MIADFYTKPLQGELFKSMRDKIMGVTSMVWLIIYMLTSQEYIRIYCECSIVNARIT